MEREDLEALCSEEPATLLCRALAHGLPEAPDEGVYHFGRLRDALSFAVRELPPPSRSSAWIAVDKGLIAPEELPALFSRFAA